MQVSTAHERVAGPGWVIRPGRRDAGHGGGLGELVFSRGAARWYLGGAFALIWLISVVPALLETASGALSVTVGLLLLAVFGAAFLFAVPMSWWLPQRWYLLPAAALFALSFALFPWVGWGIRGLWTYVGVVIAMAVAPLPLTWTLLLALGVFAAFAGIMLDGWSDEVLWIPAVLVSISAMMAAFARNIVAMNELRATRDRMAAMAVERERSRVARDLHDILGHSLTVITVKSELAGRLVDVDPARARTEIGEVESLARGALADVRATVAGYRGVSLSGELAAARAALDAAEIAADVPGSSDAVPPERRELAAWVVREGVTNVMRHAAASRCRIRIAEHEVTIDDDGVGPVVRADQAGTGLAGLRERVESAGGRMTVGRSDLGGFALRVQL